MFRRLKRIFTSATAIIMAISMLPSFAVFADMLESYECVLFAQGADDSIQITSQSLNVNGTIVTNGTLKTDVTYKNINGNEDFTRRLGTGVTVPTEVEEDEDIIDIGEAYFKEITSEDDIVDAGDGIFCVRNQILLTADDTVGFNDISALATELNASIVGFIELTNDYQLEFNEEVDVEYLKSIITQLQEYSFMETAILNIVTYEDGNFYSGDSEWNTPWNEEYPSGKDWNIEAIKLKSALVNAGVMPNENSTAEECDTSNLYNVKIGLIDDYFDEDHQDLDFTKVWNNINQVHLKQELEQSKISNHGTHVAGTMGANFNNGKGISGVCVKNRLYGYAIGSGVSNELPNPVFEKKYALPY